MTATLERQIYFDEPTLGTYVSQDKWWQSEAQRAIAYHQLIDATYFRQLLLEYLPAIAADPEFFKWMQITKAASADEIIWARFLVEYLEPQVVKPRSTLMALGLYLIYLTGTSEYIWEKSGKQK